MVEKVLIISPHGDDEVLGCFSFLKDAHVLYIGLDESKVFTRIDDAEHRPSEHKRFAEMQDVCGAMGATWHCAGFEVNNYYRERNAILNSIEKAINAIRPDILLIPALSYNDDHNIVHEACLTATRTHDTNHFVPKILIYEQPHTFLDSTHTFEPNFFKYVDIELKIQTNALYATQVRSYRGPEILKAMAFLRGKQSGFDYAEGFMVRRWVDAA